MTSKSDFKGTPLFDVEYFANSTKLWHSYSGNVEY